MISPPPSVDCIELFITNMTGPELMKASVIIRDAVCERFGITREQFEMKTRNRKISRTRMVACYLMRKHTPVSVAVIGERYSMDHSNVTKSYKKVSQVKNLEQWINETK